MILQQSVIPTKGVSSISAIIALFCLFQKSAKRIIAGLDAGIEHYVLEQLESQGDWKITFHVGKEPSAGS